MFFADKSIDIFEGVPIRLNIYMLVHRSENIIAALSFNDLLIPYFKEKLIEVRQMIVVWNQHMNYVLLPSWVSCLDDSISIWNKKFTCPGWMFVPRKPHP